MFIKKKQSQKVCIPNTNNCSESNYKSHIWKGFKVLFTMDTLKKSYNLCFLSLWQMVSYYNCTELVDFLRFIISALQEHPLMSTLNSAALVTFLVAVATFLEAASKEGKFNLTHCYGHRPSWWPKHSCKFVSLQVRNNIRTENGATPHLRWWLISQR